MTAAEFDYEAGIPPGFYDEIYRRRAGVRYCWHELKFRAVARHLGRARRLLDIGCGPGTFIGNHAGEIEALGIDLSARQIDYAQRTYGSARHRFAARSAESLVEAGERFDAITLIEVIEHLPLADTTRLFAAVRRLLVDDGVLVVTTPNQASLWPLIELAVNALSRVSYEAQHINNYRRGRLAAELRAAGFGRVEVGTAVGLAPFVGVLGVGVAQAADGLERAVRHLGAGNLLIAMAKPG